MTDVAGSLVSSSSGSGAGTIQMIGTDTPAFVTIVNPTGPNTNVDVAVPGGTIEELTSSSPGVTITNPTGPITDIEFSSPTGINDLTTSMPSTVIITNPTGPTTNIDIVTSGSGGVEYSANAPGATPLSGQSLLAYNVVRLTGINTPITSMNPATMPTDSTYVLRVELTDNGTPQAITWGSDYAPSTQLPTQTLGSTTARLYAIFYYDVVQTKLVCVGVTPGPAISSADLVTQGSFTIPTASPAVVFTTPPVLTPGTWQCDFEGMIAATSGISTGQNIDLQPVISSGSGSIINGPGGDPPGIRWILSNTSAPASQVKVPVHLTFFALITSATATVNMNSLCGGGVYTLTATSGAFTSPVSSLTNLFCRLIG